MPRRKNGDEGAQVYREVGARIRRARGQRTQQEIADAVDLTRSSITNIEQGRQKILLHTFIRIAAALQVPPRDLLPDSEHGSAGEQPLELPADLDVKTKRFVEQTVAKAVAAQGQSRKK